MTRKRQMEWGWKTTRVTKPLLIDTMGKFMREHAAAMPSAATLKELNKYVRDDRGGMSGSPHDDRVISAGLAIQAAEYAYLPEFQDEVVYQYGTLDWYEEQLQDMEGIQRDDDLWVI